MSRQVITQRNLLENIEAQERFWSRVDRTRDPDACWQWRGTIDHHGYGAFSFLKKWLKAHRVAYMLFVGPIPPGRELDHLCRNPACVNPRHLEPVTHRENVLRGASVSAKYARRTECSRGHPFTEENTYIRPVTGYRRCRECRRKSGGGHP